MGYKTDPIALSVRTYCDFQPYSEWVRDHDTLGDADRRAIRDGIRRLRRAPLFSVIMLGLDGSVSADHGSVLSLRTQLYPHWELWSPGNTSAVDPNADRRLRTI